MIRSDVLSVRIEADRERVALLARAEHVGEDARVGLVADEVVEQQRRRVRVAAGHERDRAELLVGIDRRIDALELAGLLHAA